MAQGTAQTGEVVTINDIANNSNINRVMLHKSGNNIGSWK